MSTPNKKREDNELLQPGLDPATTGKPKEIDPRTDPKPGQKKEKGEPNYRPDL